MKYTFKQEKSEVKIKITLTAEEWADAQKEAYNKTKGKYNVPGFRKGHVPMNVIEQTYGKGIFFEDAINAVFPKHYYDVLDKEPSIEPIDRPSIDVDKLDEKGIVIVATVAVKPEVKLGEYKGINIEKVEYNVTDEDVAGELERLQKRNSREVAVTDRPSQSGDIVIIDYSGSVNGVKFEGGTAEKQTLVLGSGSFIPGFEEQVCGMEIGSEKDINVKFPDDYGAENLKGKEAVFHIKLHEIKIKELPEVTDDFIKEAAGEESVEAFKEATKKKLQEQNDKKAKYETEDKILKEICDKTEVDIPEVLVERQIDRNVQDMEYRLMYQGLKLEDYLKYTGQTMEDYRKGFKEQATEQVKAQLVMDEIIKKESIVADAEEVDKKIAEQASAMGKDAEEYKKTLNPDQLGYFENMVVSDKLFDFLTKNNIIK